MIPIELEGVDRWLSGTMEDAKSLLKMRPVEVFDAGPMPPARS